MKCIVDKNCFSQEYEFLEDKGIKIKLKFIKCS